MTTKRVANVGLFIDGDQLSDTMSSIPTSRSNLSSRKLKP